MTADDVRLRRTGYFTFFLSGLCAISSGIIVSILQDKYGFSLAMTGTLLSLFSLGNMLSGILCGLLPSRIGLNRTALLFTIGYFIGYVLTALTGTPGVLMLAFLFIGFAKGTVMGTDSVLVGQHCPDRARGMQLMHASYAAGALLCPFVASFLVGINVNLPMIAVGCIGLLAWFVYLVMRLPGKPAPAGTSDKVSPDGTSESFTGSSGDSSASRHGSTSAAASAGSSFPASAAVAASEDSTGAPAELSTAASTETSSGVSTDSFGNSPILHGVPSSAASDESSSSRRYAFLRDPSFWLLAALLFCQNGAETGVTGWLVTYYKDSHILEGTLSNYTMTIMWGATLLARLLIAFVIPIRDRFRALTIMGIGCSALYAVLVFMTEPVPAVLLLFAFSACMAGVNPMAVASAGSAMSPEGMGILLPVGGVGAIVMPLIIGFVGDSAGLRTGMFTDLIPCVGIILLSAILLLRSRRTTPSA